MGLPQMVIIFLTKWLSSVLMTQVERMNLSFAKYALSIPKVINTIFDIVKLKTA